MKAFMTDLQAAGFHGKNGDTRTDDPLNARVGDGFSRACSRLSGGRFRARPSPSTGVHHKRVCKLSDRSSPSLACTDILRHLAATHGGYLDTEREPGKTKAKDRARGCHDAAHAGLQAYQGLAWAAGDCRALPAPFRVPLLRST